MLLNGVEEVSIRDMTIVERDKHFATALAALNRKAFDSEDLHQTGISYLQVSTVYDKMTRRLNMSRTNPNKRNRQQFEEPAGGRKSQPHHRGRQSQRDGVPEEIVHTLLRRG